MNKKPKTRTKKTKQPLKETPVAGPARDRRLLAVVLRRGTWLLHGFFKEALQGIQRVAFSQGYGLVILDPAMANRLEASEVLASLREMTSGLLLVAPEADAELLSAVAKSGLPAMLLYGRYPSLSFVQVDNEGGAFAAVEHLIQLKHKRIAFLNGPANAVGAQERLSGYIKALEKHGIPLRNDYIVTADYDQARAYKAMKELLRRDLRPTALFAANDQMALGAISAVKDEGLSVPGDMAVVGFDDLDLPSLTFRSPPLTTVRQPIYEIAKEGAEGLIFAIEGRITDLRQRVFPSQLIVRSTCGSQQKKTPA